MCPRTLTHGGRELAQRYPIRQPGLRDQTRHVLFHGPLGKMQPVGDLPVAQPLDEQLQHLVLPGGDPGRAQRLRNVLDPAAALGRLTNADA